MYMKKIFIIGLVFSGFLCLPAAATYTPDDMGCSFIKPPGWKIDYHSDEAFLMSDSLNENTRIEIYKYLLDANHQIGSEEELIEAVHGLYEEIGVDTATKAKIVCTVEDSLVYFETDFIDSSSESKLYHVIIRGILGRLEGDGQVLFLIKAVTPQDLYELSRGDLNLILYSFHFTDPLDKEFYVRTNMIPYLLMLLIFLLTAFFYARNRRVQNSKNPLGRDSGNYWRCPNCRLVNHINNKSCQRCGWQNRIIQSSKK